MRGRVARGLVALGLSLALAACSAAPAPRPTAALVAEVLAAAPASDPVPDAAASARLADATVRLIAGELTAPDGWLLVPLSDVTEGRALVERARPTTAAGVVAVRGRAGKAVALAVPVVGGEADADALGVELFTRSSAIALVVAGSPTGASASGSAFGAVTSALGERGLLLAVVEGYAPDAAADSPEVVLRGATGTPSDEELRLGTVLQQAGVVTCVLVGEECHDPAVALEQGEAVAGGAVVRLQVAGRLRTDPSRRAAVLAGLAHALGDL